MTSTSNNQENPAKITGNARAIHNVQVDSQSTGNVPQVQELPAQAGNEAADKGKAESELRAAARRHGLTLKELASLMGVNYGHLCSVANGHRPWTPMMTERVRTVLGEVPGQGIVYRQGGVVTGESSVSAPRYAA